ncbi:MAG: NADH-quinone oxidoreductase subunit J, partial [Actinomycetota bacterium]|nr:NADH-quinone oxidoreductase subunit J [Actinomycetota bacterium]
TAPLGGGADNTRRLGEALFTDYVFAVELTALLLTVAVVGAVVLARTVKGALQPLPVVVVATAKEPPGATEERSGVDPDTEIDSGKSIEGGDG